MERMMQQGFMACARRYNVSQQVPSCRSGFVAYIEGREFFTDRCSVFPGCSLVLHSTWEPGAIGPFMSMTLMKRVVFLLDVSFGCRDAYSSMAS